MKTILCYGDSNTFGFIPGEHGKRFDISKRWPKLLEKKLGEGFYVIEEGLRSRTILSEDIRFGKEGKCGCTYLLPCLDSHDPLDLVIIMLGMNELKYPNCKTAKEIGKIMERYMIDAIQTRPEPSGKHPEILLVAPPKIGTRALGPDGKFDEHAIHESVKLEEIYKAVAARKDCFFVSALEASTGIDGTHLSEEGHAELAEILYHKIKCIFSLKLF